MLGDNARAVRIKRRNGSPIVLVCPDAEKVVAAVEEARARLQAGAVPRTRVSVESEGESEGEGESAARRRGR
jgi:hypothetical protein